MDLMEVFGSARAEHEQDHPTPAARPDPDPILMKPMNREQSFEMFETGDPRDREFALEASCPRS